MLFVLVSVFLSVSLSAFLASFKPSNNAGGDHHQKTTFEEIQMLILP